MTLVGILIAIGAIVAVIYIFRGSSKETDNPLPVNNKIVVAGPYSVYEVYLLINLLFREEIGRHNGRDDLWIIVNNKVYDVTSRFKSVNCVLCIM